jgi:hypothetical protein
MGVGRGKVGVVDSGQREGEFFFVHDCKSLDFRKPIIGHDG